MRGTRRPPHKRLYGRAWERARSLYLTLNPYCRICAEQGRVTAAMVIDHITPHRGDLALFWDEENWQPLCKQHHDRTKQAEEKRWHSIGCDINGLPLDPMHPWYTDGRRS